MSSSTEMTATTKITPEVLQELLQHYNLSRREFIDTYNIQPLVYIPELPAGAKTMFVVMYVIIFALALVGNSLVVWLVWIAAVMVGSPMLFVQQLEVKYDFLYDHHHVCCQERWHSLLHRQVYTTFIMVALFLLPLAAMLFLYSRIGIELWIRKRVGDSSVLSTMNHREINKISRQVKKKRAVKMMITIVLLFTICWAPFHIVHMLFEYNELEKNYDEVTVNMIIAVVQAIGFSNSFNNPIIYAFMNENFKKNCVATLHAYLRRPVQQSGAVQRPNLSVHFSKHLKIRIGK
ncbi:pyroglutamylated RFamide peptide receptor-like [Sinocyclocheilus rhinocerous]|uniref:pyroglutamylated RFamide peptide receptor-like n=1 Tax=Sinocyclocheilus rhinocerous TaxID=307959 RepID=UPI0007B7BEA8|nr:PREDICTED: pyroglutamylated RFamide peptide receptor-like [Sinocyclocheilus rhinocerous]